jgi:hypothetical protein
MQSPVEPSASPRRVSSEEPEPTEPQSCRAEMILPGEHVKAREQRVRQGLRESTLAALNTEKYLRGE